MQLHNWSVRNWIPMALLATLSAVGAIAQPYAYVSSWSNTIAVVNSSGTVVSTIRLPGINTASGVAITPDGNYLYVAGQASANVLVVSTASNSVVANIPVGYTPVELAVTPDGSQVFVVNRASYSVSVISTASQTVTATVPVASKPMAVAFSADGTKAYVPLYGGAVDIIDTATKNVTSFGGVTNPSSVAVARNHVYVGNQGTATVTVHDLSGNLLATISGIVSPSWMAATPDGNRLYVSNGNTAAVTAIDLNSNSTMATIPTGSMPTSVAVSADGAYVYVTNEYAMTMSQISTATNTVTATNGRVGSYPFSVVTSPGGGSSVVPSCTYSLSGSGASFPAAGGAGSFNVTAPTGCSWSVTNNPGWVIGFNTLSGSGNGTVSYTVTANSGAAQTASLNVGGQTYMIQEAGISSHIRVRCGGPSWTDSSNNVWTSDNATSYSATTASISNTTTSPLYQTEAWSNGTLTYTYSVTPGTYTVALKFAEFYMTQAGQRKFNIVINGTTYASGFDILGNTNTMNTAIDEKFTVTSSGQITIQLVPVSGPAKISAIEIY